MEIGKPAENAASANWHDRARNVEFRHEPFINGRYAHSAQSNRRFETVNPATEGVVAKFPAGSADDVDTAVRAARSAFSRQWSAVSPDSRKAQLLRWADNLESRANDLALRDCIEMGKPIKFALGDIVAGIRFIRFYAETADKFSGDVAPTDAARGITFSLPEPWGVVGAIVPWNFPFLTACMAAGPALAAGNTIVLKPSEVSPSSALLMAEIASESGLPDGVVNVVPGLGSTVGAALAQHNDVDKLHFTGSTATGRRMLMYSAESNGKAVMLEVGGKNPQIVFEDAADMAGLGEALSMSAFFNTGQVCVSRSRLIVHRSIAGRVIEQVRTAAGKLVSGDPLDSGTNYGPVSSQMQLDKIEYHVSAAIGAGAESILGGGRLKTPGYYFPPTILTNVREDMSAAREEIFGPVVSVHTFDSEDEAIELANGTQFGLAATAWTTDVATSLKLVRRLQAGRVEIRASASPASSLELFSAEPFGQSGFGVLGGVRGIEPYLRWKGVEFVSG